ncbi:MAG: hypothetical protein JWN72_1844, partial [Thermoleophilia bacterium]|nr:hypothetical protein [Thermoleophilia bacterium]
MRRSSAIVLGLVVLVAAIATTVLLRRGDATSVTRTAGVVAGSGDVELDAALYTPRGVDARHP